MNTIRKVVMIAAILVAIAATALAQVPTRTKLRFTMNVPYALMMGGYSLPAGHYILWQDSQNPNLFRLYENDLARAPVATIYTVRGRYWTVPRNRQTGLTLDIDESTGDMRPVLRGFDVPFDDPWEVISVKVREGSPLTRLR